MIYNFKNTNFLYEVTSLECNVVVCGADRVGKDAFLSMNDCMHNINVVAVLDDKRDTIHGLEHLGKIVHPLSAIVDLDYDYFIIAADDEESFNRMKVTAIQVYNVDFTKILVYSSPTPKQILLPRLDKIPFISKRIYFLMERLLDERENCQKQVEDELKALSNIIKHERIWLNYREWHADENNRCAYLQVPKVASTSITKAIRRIGDTHGLLVSDIEGETRYRYNLPKEFDGFKFTFVRNPFARIVSCYRNRVEGRNQAFFRYYKIIGLDQDYGFDSFVRAISEVPDEWAERHFASQYFQVYKDGKCLVDFIGHFENLTEDYKKISDKYGLIPLEHRNASTKYDYRDFYTEELANLVYERYKIDFDTFGYNAEYDDLINYIRR